MGNIIADMIVRVRGEGDGAVKEMDRVDRRFATLASSLARRGGMIRDVLSTAFGFALGQIIDRAVRGVADLGRVAITFEANMANVNSIAQLTDDQLASLSKQVNDLAGKTAQSPAVLAAGLYDIYSSGFKGAAALQVLEASANAATAGLTTTDVAARAITATMNAYGQSTYTAQQISDVYFQTVQDGVLTFDELANNLGKTLPLASALGVAVTELAAAYAQLTLNGVNASAAETNITGLMKAAANPTDALTKAVSNYGYASVQALIDAEGLPGFIKAVMQAADGNTAALYDMLQNQEAVNAALILGKNGTADYAAEVEKMNKQLHMGGATQAALEKQHKSTAFALKLLRVSLEQVGIAFLGIFTPAIRGAAILLSYLAQAMLPLAEGTQKVVGFFTNVFGEGNKVETVLDKLFGGSKRLSIGMGSAYQPLKRTGSALQSLAKDAYIVVDSIGDLVSRWQSKGFDGMLQILPRELGQIGDALWDVAKILGEKAFDGLVTLANVTVDIGKWAIGKIPDLWSWLQGVIGMGTYVTGDGTGGPDSDNNVTLTDVGVNILSWAWGNVVDLWGWINGKLGVHGDQPLNIYTGEGGNAVSLTDVGVNILSWAWGSVADLWGWITDNVKLGSNPDAGSMNWGYVPDGAISLEDVAVNIASFVIGTVAGWGTDALTALQDWIDKNAPADVSASINVVGYTTTFGALAKLDFKAAIQNFVATDPIKVTPELELDVKLGVENWIRNFGKEDMPDWKLLLLPLLGPFGFLGAMAAWIDTKLAPDAGKLLLAGIEGAFAGLFTDKKAFIPGMGGGQVLISNDAATRFWKAMLDELSAGLDALKESPFGDLTESVTGWISTEFTNITDWLMSHTPDWIKKLFAGDLEGAVKSLFDYYKTDNNNHVISIGGALTPNFGPSGSGSVTAGYGSWAATKPSDVVQVGPAPWEQQNYANRFVPQASSNAGTLASGEQVTTLPATGAGPSVGPTKIPAPDISAYQTAMSTLAASTTMSSKLAVMAIMSMSSQIQGALSSLASVMGSQGQSIGNSLGQGIVSGMELWTQRAASTAAAIVNAAIVAARQAAGNPNSPSPVTEDRIGSPLGEGIFVGMLKWKDKVRGVMSDLATTDDYRGGPTGFNGVTAAGAGGSSGGGALIQVQLTIEGNVYGVDDLDSAIEGTMTNKVLPHLVRILSKKHGK